MMPGYPRSYKYFSLPPSMKRERNILYLIITIIFTMACNFPGLTRPDHGISVNQLRQTLAAPQTTTAEPVTTLDPTPNTLLQGAPATAPFAGLYTATPPGSAALPTAPSTIDATTFQYIAQPGDTLAGLSGRFEVDPASITSPQPIPGQAFIPAGQLLLIPRRLGETLYTSAILPDSEIINSPSAVGFSIGEYVRQANGYLSNYSEIVQGETLSGAEIIQRVAIESSIHPRFLLAWLEYRSGWVTGQPSQARNIKYPIGFGIPEWSGLYKELVMTATHLNAGYYGWRSGTITQLEFRNGAHLRIHPTLNAGSAAVQSLTAKLTQPGDWPEAIYGSSGFIATYTRLFGDAWLRAAAIEPLFPADLQQPLLELPFAEGERWSFTGGPHPSWKTGSPYGAIDLAPVTGEIRCAVSYTWVLASAPGVITRSERNVVTIDLDGDGNEQTGWVVLYLHVADKDRIQTGARVATNDRLGHPSCEGGNSTGTHVHIARKYNGEWLPADGPIPMILSNWQVYAGAKIYQGEMRRGEQTAVASPVGPRTSIVTR